MKALSFFFLFLATCSFSQEQSGIIIFGKLIDSENSATIPYAKVYNKTNEEGTISNDEGYFRIRVTSLNDNVLVSQIGYKTQNLFFEWSTDFQTFKLNANLQLIGEVEARPRDISYLCRLIQNCRLNENKTRNNGKAYYELKTFIDTNQIELVEGFYNYTSTGYDLGNIELKAGRLAIKPDDGTMFLSLESSKAITQLRMFKSNAYFPEGPFEMKARIMEKKFYMSLRSKYLLENKDSVYVINYQPKDTSGNYFEGTIWINKSKSQVLKVTTNCVDCAKYPFLPIFPIDEIKRLDMNITKTFTESNGKMCFNHVDFQYNIDYKSIKRDSNFLYSQQAVDSQNDSLFQFLNIKTNAVLYSYDQKNQFNLPKFTSNSDISDYSKINALPYNSFFWEKNNEDRVNDEKNKNQLFFSDKNSVSNKDLFDTYFYRNKKHPGFIYAYKDWSKNRIRFRNISEKENLEDGSKANEAKIMTEGYELEVQIFADINNYGDSIHILTAAIFDPFKSFYNLPIDMGTHCFINMYFDLYEIARRELQKKLEENPKDFDEIYTKFINMYEKTKRQFYRDVERGTNEKGMVFWNDIIKENLGIDNLELFHPFPKESEKLPGSPK